MTEDHILEAKVAAVVLSLVSAALMICLIRQSLKLNYARLICDNRILSSPLAIVTRGNTLEQHNLEEVVISTFGLLLGNRIYKWGCDGIHGSRLSKIKFDRQWIWVVFGTNDNVIGIKVLHGIIEQQAVREASQKLKYETGVQAEISEWLS